MENHSRVGRPSNPNAKRMTGLRVTPDEYEWIGNHGGPTAVFRPHLETIMNGGYQEQMASGQLPKGLVQDCRTLLNTLIKYGEAGQIKMNRELAQVLTRLDGTIEDLEAQA